jgi:hypothetical protein
MQKKNTRSCARVRVVLAAVLLAILAAGPQLQKVIWAGVVKSEPLQSHKNLNYLNN